MAKTIFNINDQHVKNVNAVLKQRDLVIIHGDGHMFASNNGEIVEYIDDTTGQLVRLPLAMHGSMIHKTFHAGYDNREAVAKAGFRAIYKKGDKGPDSVQDIENAFMNQANDDLAETVASKPTAQSNIFKFDELPVPEAKKAGRPKNDQNPQV